MALNTKAEAEFLTRVTSDVKNAENTRKEIEVIWEDEEKIFIGDQWSTSFAKRSEAAKKTRPNSVDNFVFPAIINKWANITATTPRVTIEGQEPNDGEVAAKLTDLCQFNDERNNFRAVWKKMVLQFLKFGPIIGAVVWDGNWMGGTGPYRWVGDVRIQYIKKDEIYFDPAILDLEERLQECSFIFRKVRKKLKWFRDTYEKGHLVAEDVAAEDEGEDPQQATLYEYWYRGKPDVSLMTEEMKRRFAAKAEELAAEGDYYKAEEYRAMAAGTLDGVHCVYCTENVFLEYVPYVYEDGLYPFVYKVLYADEKHPYGMGEIRNVKIPQVLHNKADEIEIEAMEREGLGGIYYSKSAFNKQQLDNYIANNHKGGAAIEVADINMIKERQGARVPQSLIQYKEHKQRMVEIITQNTAIQQGLSPSSQTPLGAIRELGARSDVRLKIAVEILEDFLIEMNKLRLNRFAQFYDTTRYYRIKGIDGKWRNGTFKNKEMFMRYEREVEGGITRMETFVPEFDVTVKVMDERPTDRNYYTNTVFTLLGAGAIDIQSLWETLDEGVFPPKDVILSRLKAQNIALQMTQAISQLPPELQDAYAQSSQMLLQNFIAQAEQPGPFAGGQVGPGI